MAHHRYLKRPSRDRLREFFKVEELPDQNDIVAIRDFVTEWFSVVRGVTAPGINCGYCFIWTYLVWALATPRTVTFVSDSSHVCVKHGGLYYDSEHCAHKDPNVILQHRHDGCDKWFWRMTDVTLYWGRNGTRKHVFKRVLKTLSGIRFSDLLRTNRQLRGTGLPITGW